MLRSSLISASALVLCCATANGQSQQVQARKVTMPTKDAGIYHVATGTWTRNAGATANIGPDVIFRADSPSGYFGVGWEGSEGVDEGVLPGIGNPQYTGGTNDAYTIDGYTFGYCSTSGGAVNWTLKFYDSYVPCDDPDIPANCICLVGTNILTGLPAAGFCWTVTIDLAGGYEFCVGADGGPCAPGYQGVGSGLDSFGWGAIWATPSGGTTGPLLQGGDANWMPEGDGTCYQAGFSNACAALVASGAGQQDLFGIGNPLHGCFWFGGYVPGSTCGSSSKGPAAQFTMILFTNCDGNDCEKPGGTFCDVNPNNAATISLSGTNCAAGSITVDLGNAGAFDGNFTYLLIGNDNTVTVTDPPGAAGDLCLAGGPIGRYVGDAGAIAAGTYSTDILNHNTGAGGDTIPTLGGNICSPAGQTFYFQYWHRDGMNPSKFSQGVEGTFN